MLYVRVKLRQQSCASCGWETGRHEIQPEIRGFTRSSGEIASHLAPYMPRVQEELPSQ